MKKTIDVDTVLDLIRKHQEELAGRVDMELTGSGARKALWVEYKEVSKLYDDVRRASNVIGQQAT